MADLIVKHGYVVTMNGTREIFSDGAVAVEGNRIVAVGRAAEVLAQHRARETIDATDMVVIPGLIDGHNHPAAYLLGGMSDDTDIMTGLYKNLYPYEEHLSEEETYVCGLGNYLEMIKNGTTCFNDPGGCNVDQLAQAAVDIGIRGIINRSTRDVAPPGKPLPPRLFEDLETNLGEGEKTVARWNGAANDRIRAWFSLRYVFNISDRLVAGIRDLAAKHKVGVHAHVAAVKGENEAILAIYGKRSLQRYYDLGLFAPNLYCVHMGYPSEQEVEWLVKHDVKVAHCPSAAMRGAWGVIANKMIPYMAKKGVCISIGTDTNGAAGNLDMFRVLYVGATIHRDMYDDPSLWGAYKVLEMATIDGARACLWDKEIGSLEAGKKADIVLVDRAAIEWKHPGRDPVRSLVYSASGGSVDTVIVDGRIVMRKRQVLTVDEEAVKRDVVRAGKAWLGRAGLGVRTPWPVR
jgi:cytosine/adenosine deaminase-related metal-dependent hydrolase